MSTAERLAGLFVAPARAAEPAAGAERGTTPPSSAPGAPPVRAAVGPSAVTDRNRVCVGPGPGADRVPASVESALGEDRRSGADQRAPAQNGALARGRYGRGRRKPRPALGAGYGPEKPALRVVADEEAERAARVVADQNTQRGTRGVVDRAPDAADAVRAGDGRRASEVACGVRVCVLGGGRNGASFARALVARLSRLPGARCAVLCAAPAEDGLAAARPPGPAGPPTPVARRVARGLVADGHAASVRGRVVEVALGAEPGAAGDALTALDARIEGAPALVVLPGVRRPAFDAVVARQDAVFVVVGADAPPALPALAVAELARVAPGAVVQAVPLPARLGAGARRAAVGRALGVLG